MQAFGQPTFDINSVSPHPMKVMATQYFDVIKRKIPVKFNLTARDAFLSQSYGKVIKWTTPWTT